MKLLSQDDMNRAAEQFGQAEVARLRQGYWAAYHAWVAATRIYYPGHDRLRALELDTLQALNAYRAAKALYGVNS